MRMLLAAILVLLPATGWAGAWSKDCQFTGGTLVGTVGTPKNTSKTIGPGDFGCYRFVVGDSTHNSSTSTFMNGFVHVTAPSAVITFDPALDAEGPDVATVEPHFCPQGDALTPASPGNSCLSMGGANTNINLDGTEGAAGVQNAAIRVGTGVFFFEVTTACVTGNTCQISVKGEE